MAASRRLQSSSRRSALTTPRLVRRLAVGIGVDLCFPDRRRDVRRSVQPTLLHTSGCAYVPSEWMRLPVSSVSTTERATEVALSAGLGVPPAAGSAVFA